MVATPSGLRLVDARAAGGASLPRVLPADSQPAPVALAPLVPMLQRRDAPGDAPASRHGDRLAVARGSAGASPSQPTADFLLSPTYCTQSLGVPERLGPSGPASEP